MKQAGTRQLYSYWNSLRGERATPAREDIDPAAIRGALRDTFILEVDPARTLPMRVTGAGLSNLFVRELKGESFAGLFADEDQERLRAIVDSVLDDPAPAVAGVCAAPARREAIDLELLLLPLRHQGRTHARLLGALCPARYPTWLGLLPVEPLELTSLRLVRPETMLHARLSRAPERQVLELPGIAFRPRVVEGGRTG